MKALVIEKNVFIFNEDDCSTVEAMRRVLADAYDPEFFDARTLLELNGTQMQNEMDSFFGSGKWFLVDTEALP